MSNQPYLLQLNRLVRAVNNFSQIQNVSTDRLALILELIPEVFDAMLAYSSTMDGRTVEMLQRLFWIMGLNEADPTLFGVSSDDKVSWIRQNAEFVGNKRQELFSTAVANQRAAQEASIMSGANAMFVMFLITAICALAGVFILLAGASPTYHEDRAVSTLGLFVLLLSILPLSMGTAIFFSIQSMKDRLSEM